MHGFILLATEVCVDWERIYCSIRIGPNGCLRMPRGSIPDGAGFERNRRFQPVCCQLPCRQHALQFGLKSPISHARATRQHTGEHNQRQTGALILARTTRGRVLSWPPAIAGYVMTLAPALELSDSLFDTTPSHVLHGRWRASSRPCRTGRPS
jgi:hypothetical protein